MAEKQITVTSPLLPDLDELLKVTEAIAWYTTNEKHIENISKYEADFNEAKQKREAQREQAERLE